MSADIVGVSANHGGWGMSADMVGCLLIMVGGACQLIMVGGAYQLIGLWCTI